MSIIVDKVDSNGRYVKGSAKVMVANSKAKNVTTSLYTPNEYEQKCRNEFLNDFRHSWQTMHLPRPEFNDLSLSPRLGA
jgi:ribosomal protein L14E/L6E/L27E